MINLARLKERVEREYRGTVDDARLIEKIPKLIEMVEILAAACEEMKNRKPYKCWECDGGERYQETAEEALSRAQEIWGEG